MDDYEVFNGFHFAIALSDSFLLFWLFYLIYNFLSSAYNTCSALYFLTLVH